MKNLQFNPYILLFGTLLLILNSCGNKTDNTTAHQCDSLKYNIIAFSDSIKDATGSTIIVNANVALPLNESEDKDISSVYNKYLLNLKNDSITGENAVITYVKKILDFYKTPAENIPPELEDETEKVSKYEINHNITPIFNSCNIFCVMKNTNMKKDGNSTIETNNYFSFNTSNCSRINIMDIIKDEYSTDINNLLKERLMQQEGVTNQSQLIDLGYFNIDNLSINNNFFFKDNKIVFAYEPYEIACLQVGEVCIALEIDELTPYIKENSILSKLNAND